MTRALLLVTMLPACSSISADQACIDSAHAQCTEIQQCEPETMAFAYGTEANCETRLKQSCVDSLSAAGTGASPSHTESCATAYGTWSCSDYLAHANIPAACAQPLGSSANGASCAFAGQCRLLRDHPRKRVRHMCAHAERRR